MATFNIISHSQIEIEGLTRLDAESFDKDVLTRENIFLLDGGVRLSALVDRLPKSQISKSDSNKINGIDYISISDIDSRDGKFSQNYFIRELLPSRAKWNVCSGDILVSTVRPNRGAVSFVPSSHKEKLLASSGFYPIFASSLPQKDQALLFAFFRSKFAREQLTRRCRNSMYPVVAPEDCRSVIIPKISFNILNELNNAFTKLNEEYSCWNSIRHEKELLFNKLLQYYSKPPSPIHSNRRLDTTLISRDLAFGGKSANRIDAEFFRKEYIDFEKNISQNGYYLLSDYFELKTGRVNKGTDSVPIIKQNILTNSGPNYSNIELEPAKAGGGVRVIENDILLACTAHEVEYVGKKVELVRELPSEYKDNQAVAELMILRPINNINFDISKSFVVDFLRSDFGMRQVQRCIRGVRGGHTYPSDISKFVRVPKLKKSDTANYEQLSEKLDVHRRNITVLTNEMVNILEKYIQSEF